MSNESDKLANKKAELETILDDLLERYLILLDQYQTLQAELSRHLASGYLSLAQANFTAPNGIRYGPDFYDERAQASSQVTVSPSDPAFSLSADPPADAATFLEGQTNPQTRSDPLHWFGVLVPSALKACQLDFKAVLSYVPTIANVATEMKSVEIEVRRTRKRLSKVL
ncbi:MAG: hypothetical protein Q9163_002200 [Psora crenata]